MQKTFEVKVKKATDTGTVRMTVPKLIADQLELVEGKIVRVTIKTL